MTNDEIEEIALECGIIPNLNPCIYEFAYRLLEQYQQNSQSNDSVAGD